MDVLLKKYFWVVNLVVIATCASLAGRAGAHYAEQVVLMGGDDAPGPRRPALPPPEERPRSKEIEGILDRNIFCSTCAPIKPKADPTGPQDDGNAAPQKSSLQLELVSTMVVPSDELWSMAVIRDLSTKDHEPQLYRRGSSLAGGQATVARVVEKRVYLRNSGRLEYLELDGAAPLPQAQNNGIPPGAGVPGASQTALAQVGDPVDDSIGSRVRCTGAQCEIERGLVDQLLNNTTALATAARFVPSIKDGRPNGFKLYAIRPSSIFGRIGLQNGDTIKSINGLEMNTPDQALGVYTKVRNASHLTVTVDRRGETVTLDYTIR
ncbi:MAG TPA: type II secretion system protein GspC [Polyangia bacterium]|jgi:general secretion pathway protein C|nr:type II secretion system protein GspC [Polyangia bacterium]